MSFYRSEPVSYFSVIIPRENVWSVLHAMAETELIHLNPCSTAVSNKAFIFRLRTCEEALQKVTHLRTLLPADQSYKLDPVELMTASKQLIKEKNEESMLNELHEIVAAAWQEHQLRKKRIEQLMEDQSEIENRIAVLDVGGSLFGDSLFEQTSHYKCGVLPTKDIPQFEKIVFRMTKGMSFIKVISFVNGKSIFFIFYNRGQRDYLGTKLTKLIQTHSQEFCFPANPSELRKLKVDLGEQSQQSKKLIKLCREEEEQAMQKLIEAVSENSQMSKIEFYYWHILKEREICRQLVCMKQHGHFFETTAFILTADIERAINLHTSADSPSPQFTPIYHFNKPTQLTSNSFTTSSLQILLAYGVPSYQQVNPAFFNLITFPFLFGVMFGDMAHGLILFIFALTLFLWPKKYPQLITKNLLPHAQMLILMGFFAFYCGLIYNEFFSMSLNLFGSCYPLPEAQLVQECVYPVGIDPIWNISVNSLNFTNSLKMKIAVIIGVVHMTLGLCIKANNMIFFGRWIELMFQFVPQLLFFVCLFGYMDFLIIYKWLTSWPQNEAPSIITIMINIPLRLGRTEQCCGGQPMWGTFQQTSQNSIQLALLIIALICVPLMLVVKPIYIQFKQNKETRLHEQSDRLEVRGAFLEEEEGGFQKVNKGELWVHQLILTIEYVLGSISNTASYLRLWALSLAHSQLSDVFFAKTVESGLDKGYAGIGLNLLLFPTFAALTFGILLCMDSMECFLHTLRLHWVEFQNKFFNGEGFLFQPFKFIGKEV